MAPGETLDILTGLGNGYDLTLSGENPVLLGGGVGVPPLYHLAKCLLAQGKSVHVILGFNTQSEIFYEEQFRALGCTVTVTTVDGSYGKKGFVTDALPESYSYFYTCGPEPMLKAVYRATTTSGQMSFTVDGSYGKKGFVTDALPESYSYFYTCGPEPMLKAVYRATTTSGQMSFEERMGCGFGACMGCSCKTLTGYKRICKEGPVMKKEEILWQA